MSDQHVMVSDQHVMVSDQHVMVSDQHVMVSDQHVMVREVDFVCPYLSWRYVYTCTVSAPVNLLGPSH